MEILFDKLYFEIHSEDFEIYPDAITPFTSEFLEKLLEKGADNIRIRLANTDTWQAVKESELVPCAPP